MKKVPSPRRQTTRSTSNLNKDNLSSTNIQVIKPVAVRPPSTDSTQTPYNLRSRCKLKSSHTHHSTEVIPSFTEKLSLDTPQTKPVPPLTRAAAASAGVKIDSFISDESTKTSNHPPKTLINSQQSTRSSTTRKRKASEDDQRPYLDLLKMKQVILFVNRIGSRVNVNLLRVFSLAPLMSLYIDALISSPFVNSSTKIV